MRIIDTRTGAVTDAPTIDGDGERYGMLPLAIIGAVAILAIGVIYYGRHNANGNGVAGNDPPTPRPSGVAGGQ